MGERIDAYVERWHTTHGADVDIGVIDLPVIGEVDLFPDVVEKAIHKKLLKSVMTNVLETEVTVAGIRMKLQPVYEVDVDGGRRQ